MMAKFACAAAINEKIMKDPETKGRQETKNPVRKDGVSIWKMHSEKAFPLRGRCPSSQTGADEVFHNAYKSALHFHLISRCATASPRGEAFSCKKD